MNQQDRDRELMSYVRGRMSTDMPADFVSSVMYAVHRTPQRRSWGGWPILAGAATVAAGVAAVAIGLSVVRSPQVAEAPSPTPAASPTATEASVTPAPSPTATPEPTREASPEPGAHGPIWSMPPEEAFADPQRCEYPVGLPPAQQVPGVRYAVSYPGDWYTNPAGTYVFIDIGVQRSECTLFGSQPFEPMESGSGDTTRTAVFVDVSPGGDFGIPGTVVSETEFTVDGVPAVRYEFATNPEGIVVAPPSVYWIVGVGGSLPSETNEQPFVMLYTSSEDPAELAANADVLDRMAATFEVLEP